MGTANGEVSMDVAEAVLGGGLRKTGKRWLYMVAVNALHGDGDIAVTHECLWCIADSAVTSELVEPFADKHQEEDFVGAMTISPDGTYWWKHERAGGRPLHSSPSHWNVWLRGLLTLRAAELLSTTQGAAYIDRVYV